MRISDWSSDVCSSDLLKPAHHQTFCDLLDVLGWVDSLAQPVFAQLHVLFPCSSRLAELLKKTQIVVEEQPQIVDAVAQHRHALHAHAERVAGIFFGIDTDRLQHLRMHDAAAQHFQPARAAIRSEEPKSELQSLMR